VLQAFSASVDPIYCLAISKDGRYAACGRSNQHLTSMIWPRGSFVAQVGDPAEKNGAAHRALVQSLSFSPDGTKLVSGSFREVKIWKLEMGKADASAAKLVSNTCEGRLDPKDHHRRQSGPF
jgi:WD40 repeat protein